MASTSNICGKFSGFYILVVFIFLMIIALAE